jgi:hypothetical protein
VLLGGDDVTELGKKIFKMKRDSNERANVVDGSKRPALALAERS